MPSIAFAVLLPMVSLSNQEQPQRLIANAGINAQMISSAHTYDGASMLVIGNSLAYHGALPAIGWYGNWGMAASSQENDLSHRVAAQLNIGQIDIVNVSGWENTYKTTLPTQIAQLAPFISAPVKPDIVLVRLGDNVPDAAFDAAAFMSGLDSLDSVIGPQTRVVCTSSWYPKPAQDEVMFEWCSKKAGAWVSISDMYYQTATYWALSYSGAVQSHPNDSGHAEIARRIVSVVERSLCKRGGI